MASLTALVVALLLAQADPELEVKLEPCTAEHPCDGATDYPRLKVTLVNESARADRAEARADLLEQAAAVAQRIAQEQRQSSLMWRHRAEELALPPRISPLLCAGLGLAGGVALTVAIVVLVR